MNQKLIMYVLQNGKLPPDYAKLPKATQERILEEARAWLIRG
jgi:hypothetical protein